MIQQVTVISTMLTLNEVCFGHWRPIKNIVVNEKFNTRNGIAMYRIIMHMKIQIGNWTFENGENHFEVLAEGECYGGHESLELSAAYKGAYTNAFKKASAMLGVGRKTYEGQLDDDFISYQMELKEQERQQSQVKQSKQITKSQQSQSKPKRTPEERKKAGIEAIQNLKEQKGLSEAEFVAIISAETGKKIDDLPLNKIIGLHKIFEQCSPNELKEIAKAHLTQQQAEGVA